MRKCLLFFKLKLFKNKFGDIENVLIERVDEYDLFGTIQATA